LVAERPTTLGKEIRMGSERWTRRQVLAGIGGAGLGVAWGRLPAWAAAGGKPDGHGPEEALLRLKEGNERFVRGVREPDDLVKARGALASGQRPFATIVGCSDSRVAPEIVFDQSLGQLFVIRVAGNVACDDAIASVQYAIHHLHSPLVVVLGHETCGAVTAALGTAEERAREPRQVQQLLAQIRRSIGGAAAAPDREAQVRAGVAANVSRNVDLLAAVGDLKKAQTEARVKIVGAVYDMKSGRVRWLS
jgi:carbonic anhydrase